VTFKWPQWGIRYYPSICLEELRETMKTSVTKAGLHTQDWNVGPHEYEAGVPTTLPWHLAKGRNDERIWNNTKCVLQYKTDMYGVDYHDQIFASLSCITWWRVMQRNLSNSVTFSKTHS
jgi:hypothetical protein